MPISRKLEWLNKLPNKLRLRITFIYNIIFKSMLVQTPWGTSVSLGNVTNYAVLNNIMVDCHTQYRNIQGGTGTVDYNLAWSSDGSNFSLTPPLQPHEIRGFDPKFVTYTGNHNENNYHLQNGSPAIDKGVECSPFPLPGDATKH